MTAFSLAWAFLRRRWGQTILAMIVGALGIGSVETALIAERAIPEAARRAFGGVDLVVGPKGSALELSLCCALHILEPRGLLSVPHAMSFLHSQPMIKTMAPIALGDNVRGLRIVGTTTGILSIYGAKLLQGETWSGSFQAVLGSQAATVLKLSVGDTFSGTHGLGENGEPHEQKYTVSGVLAPTGTALDRLVLTDIETVHEIHEHHHHDEPEHSEDTAEAASAILVSLRSPIALASVPRLIDETPDLTASSPAMEMSRLMRAARPMISAAVVLGILFTAISVATAATSLMATMNQRVKDLALLRVLGASPLRIAAIALAEAGLYAAGAIVLGLGFSFILLDSLAADIAQRHGLILLVTPTWWDIACLIAGGFVAVILAVALPAVRAARSPIEKVLGA